MDKDTIQDDDQLVSRKVVASLLEMSEATIAGYNLPYIKKDGVVYYKLTDVIAFLDQRRIN